MASHPSASTAPCEFGLCDGSGFIDDELTKTSHDCRCRPRQNRGDPGCRAALEARIPKALPGDLASSTVT